MPDQAMNAVSAARNETFRQFLERLRAAKELVDIRQPVDIRHIATLVDQSDKALLFHNVIGYGMPVVSGIIRTRERAIMSMGCETYPEIEQKLQRGLDQPIPPRYVETAAHKQVVQTADEVDLFSLPIPMSSVYDGGPMITAGVTIARDPEYGINSGIYRFMVKEKSLTGIDIVTPNNMRLFAQRAYEAGRPCPISISIGTHPFEIMGSGFRAPLGVDEMAVAGGIRGAPVELAMCETIDLPCIADAEIVLEAEILPTGWVNPEGRFGEFTRLMGGLHWNPLVKVKAITMRRDAMYYALHMPWENTWLAAPTRYQAIRRALKTAGVQVKDINVTLGGCAFWHAIISIRKQAGEGKNALLAALSVMDLKHVVVVDDDIDVFNPTDVEWAMATRVQADRDVIIIPGARAKPLDPSLPVTPPGVVPTGAKVGIDATIGEGIPPERFERKRRAGHLHEAAIAGGDEAGAKIGQPQEEVIGHLEVGHLILGTLHQGRDRHGGLAAGDDHDAARRPLSRSLRGRQEGEQQECRGRGRRTSHRGSGSGDAGGWNGM